FRADEGDVCAPWTLCTAGEFESTQPTETSDRTCAPYAVECTDEQFEAKPRTETSDRICEDITACGHEQYEVSEPTPTADRQCEDLTQCGSPLAAVDLTLPTDGTATSDRVCCYLYEGDITVENGEGWPDMSDRSEGCFVVDGNLTIKNDATSTPTPLIRVGGQIRVGSTN